MAQDYSKSLNLPNTEFPMRAGLPKKEPETLEIWEKSDLYNKMLKKNEGKPSFILHDGPPFANGDIHIGHALNKVLKDIIIKHKSMTGYNAPYIPGWDTHGLPIEI
ncbi:MAG: class I tRNA ligase family protein, partial [Clostridia bacterium]|nr:class I tRNA ligase family protein [Clostridia bacterium]